ncbi:MAG TPA: peptidoglycan-binding domain-containing protein [Gemmataceae bacterium]|nr:peptidoglycan-binding domain-containing protein [Gemmataceae bacterium]
MQVLCTKCGKSVVCGCGSPSSVSGVSHSCAKKKGALWIHVTDDQGNAIKEAPAKKDKVEKPTDKSGISSFDPLDSGRYEVDFGTLGGELPKLYDPPPGPTKQEVKIADGEIAYVAYELKRKAALKVKVHKKGEPATVFGDATVSIVTGLETKPDKTTAGSTGVADFERVSAGEYTLKAELKPDDAKDFFTSIDFSKVTLKLTLDPGDDKTVPVEVEKKAWIAVRLEDTKGNVLTDVTVKITLPDGTEKTEKLTPDKLGPDGGYKAVYFPSGKCKVSFPEIDRDLWERVPGPVPSGSPTFQARAARKVPPSDGHPIAAGDCTWSLAALYEVPAEVIWNEPKNAALKDKCKNPNTLLPGEKIVIPDIRVGEVADLDPEACHRFRVKDVPRRMKVRFVHGGKAVPDTDCVVKITGTTDQKPRTSDGWIEFGIPADATEATIEAAGLGLGKYTLKLGHLPPVDSILGVQQRLANLGYYAGPKDGAKSDKFDDALKAFQKSSGLPATGSTGTGEVDQNTKDALVAACGA